MMTNIAIGNNLMIILSIKDVIAKYPFIFKSENNARLAIFRNVNDIRSIALKIGNKTYFEEEKLIEWVRSQTYNKMVSNKHNK